MSIVARTHQQRLQVKRITLAPLGVIEGLTADRILDIFLLVRETFIRRYSMQEPSTTRMSSKGRVVIPEDIRRRLRLQPGARFVVVGKGDVVILKYFPKRVGVKKGSKGKAEKGK